MKILSVAGFKNSGKSTLCRELIAHLQGAGLSVGYAKRTSDDIAPSDGTDTTRARAMGVPTLLWNGADFRYEYRACV